MDVSSVSNHGGVSNHGARSASLTHSKYYPGGTVCFRHAPDTPMKKKVHVAVVGAGAFGGWTALYLLRSGARVTLLDGWGPGNSRASSGGETRVIRATYGANSPYSAMAEHSRRLWHQHEKEWKQPFLCRTGVLWMATSGDHSFERGSLKMLGQAGTKYEELSVRAIKKRWPQINLEGVSFGIYEPDGGYLLARLSCQAVVERFVYQGGEYRQSAVLPRDLETGKWNLLPLADGSVISADRYVFACGAWLRELFPDTIGDRLVPTQQDVFFFATPAGTKLDDQHLPVWGDHGDRFFYGIPGNQGRGFKIADDTRGPFLDPTSGERVVSAESLRTIREYLAFRFPAMKDAPLLETRVCQYEQTPDSHFIMDHHPAAESVWLLGGGSGHGFKHGPAVGEMMAELILKDKDPQPIFRLARFANYSPPARPVATPEHPRRENL
jgi:glycine/D-amino acid oxidase-like deaminating enzyme